MLSESLDTRALRGLYECGLGERFPSFYAAWQRSQGALQTKYAQEKRQLFDDAKSRLIAHEDQLQDAIRDSYVKSMMLAYPYVESVL